MAKEVPVDADKAARKAEKRAKKEAKRSETNGVHKSSSKEKSFKGEKAAAIEQEVQELENTTKILNSLEAEKPGSVVIKEGDDMEVDVKVGRLKGALVPFANPLADEKVAKKVLKSVKRGECLSDLSVTCEIYFVANSLKALVDPAKTLTEVVADSTIFNII